MIILLFLILVSLPLHAAPVNYDEAVDGELEDTSLGLFDVGINTVTGSVTTGPADTETFNFDIGHDLEISEATITFDFTGAVDIAIFGIILSLDDSPLVDPSPISVTFLDKDIDESPASLLGEFLPLSSGNFEVLFFAPVSPPFGGGGSFDYTFSFTVADPLTPIPLPASLLLFGSSIIAMYGIKRIDITK